LPVFLRVAGNATTRGGQVFAARFIRRDSRRIEQA
jgi:hypothetical protein